MLGGTVYWLMIFVINIEDINNENIEISDKRLELNIDYENVKDVEKTLKNTENFYGVASLGDQQKKIKNPTSWLHQKNRKGTGQVSECYYISPSTHDQIYVTQSENYRKSLTAPQRRHGKKCSE